MTVSLLEILAAARAHAAPLAAESAGYVLLAVADHVVAAPRSATADDVELMPDGSVRLRARRGAAAGDESVEQSLRRLLGRALEVSSSVGPALKRAAERRDDAGLPAFVRELETALIPVNRSAARRALSRLHRETERARDAGKLVRLLQAEQPSVEVAKPAPVVGGPVVASPVAAVAVADPIAVAAEFPEPSPVVLPAVAAAPSPPVVVPVRAVAAPPRVPAPLPTVELTLTPEPLLAQGEAAFTKPEPVVLRAKERGSSTPRLGTLVTAQTLPGEDSEHTVRAPEVAFDEDAELELPIDVELEVESSERAPLVSPASLQPLADPEPSCMPDIVTAMVALHAGVDADDAPTRIRDVVTALRARTPQPRVVLEPVPVVLTPPPQTALTPEPQIALTPEPQVALTPEPQVVDDAWLTHSSLEGVHTTSSEAEADPTIHEVVTWNPGAVEPVRAQAVPLALVIAEPLPEPSPYAPAVLPTRSSDVSELLDSFHVSSAVEERELRSALKEMAGLSLTPLPHPIASER